MYKTLVVALVLVMLLLAMVAAAATQPTTTAPTSAAAMKADEEHLQAPNTGPPRSIVVAAQSTPATMGVAALELIGPSSTLTALRGSPEGTSSVTRTGNTYDTANTAEVYAAPPPRPAVAGTMRAEGRLLLS